MRVGGKLKPPLHRSHEQLVAEIAPFKSQIGDTLTEEVAGHTATFLHDSSPTTSSRRICP